jgi:hypothetical protein
MIFKLSRICITFETSYKSHKNSLIDKDFCFSSFLQYMTVWYLNSINLKAMDFIFLSLLVVYE